MSAVASLLACPGTGNALSAEPQAEPSRRTEELTVEAVENRIKQAEESKDLDDSLRTRVLELYRQALGDLRLADELAAKADEFHRSSQPENLKSRLRTNQWELAALATQPELTVSNVQSLGELEQALASRENRLAEVKKSLAELEAEPRRRASRRKEARALLFSAPDRLAELARQLEAPPPADEPPLLSAARRMQLAARHQAIEQEVLAAQNEIALYEADDAFDVVRIRRDVLSHQASLAERAVHMLREFVHQRRRSEADIRVHQAQSDLYIAHPLLRHYAEMNRELAQESQGLIQQIEQVEREHKETRGILEDLKKQFQRTREKAESLGQTGAVGRLLRKQRNALPDLRRQSRGLSGRQEAIDLVQLALFQHDDQRAELADLDRRVSRIIEGIDAPLAQAEREELESAARDLLERQREYLNSLIRNYNTYYDALLEIYAVERELIKETGQYAAFIDERVLWIRSDKPLGAWDLQRAGKGLLWLADLQEWTETGQALAHDVRQNVVLWVSILLLFAALFSVQRRFRAELGQIGEQAERSTCHHFGPTLRAAFLTVMISIFWPGMLWALGWRLGSATETSGFAKSVGHGLVIAAAVSVSLNLLRQICRSKGLAEAHFDWPARAAGLLRANLKWLLAVGLPPMFLTAALYANESEQGGTPLERLSIAAALVCLALFFQRVLRPAGGVFQEVIAYQAGGWIDRLKHVWFVLGVLVPLALAALVVCGYYYTAQRLIFRLHSTVWLVFLLVFLRAFLLRWVLVNRRRLSIEQRRAAAQENTTPDDEPANTSNIPLTNESEVDLAASSTQTRRLLYSGLATVALVGCWLIWVDVFPALSVLDRWPLWYTTSQITEEALTSNGGVDYRSRSVVEAITAGDLILAVLIGILTIVAARNIPGLLEIALLQRLPIEAALRYAVTTLASYLIVVVGIALACHTAGLGWEKVQWLAAALTFGLGFGLQEIFANFVSGLIILFERPIRVGDIVTIDSVTGVVSRIRIRATTITNWDRKEFIVPNKEFITGRLLNWTLSDAVNRVLINVGVAYGSDTEQARELLLKVAEDHESVLDDPPPIATFEDFGDSTLNFSLRAYLPNMECRLTAVHEINAAIHRTFREAGIDIAFPQRTLHLQTLPESLTNAQRQQLTGGVSSTNDEQNAA